MADSQVPWGVEALNGAVTEPAWRSKPSWYLIRTEDRMIPPLAQRMMAERAGASTTEVPGSHAIYASHPGAVAGLITQAARSRRPHPSPELIRLAGRTPPNVLPAAGERRGDRASLHDR